jgi:NAD(P)-dependent dehydrogenase (short-subunit alcohol dehydrogenase family)
VELTFATHVLAPWFLIEGLTPLLGNAAPSRVINVASGGQYDQKVPGGDIESDRTKYGPKRIYARTKREELVLTQPGGNCGTTSPRWPSGRRPGHPALPDRQGRVCAGLVTRGALA